MAGAHEARIVQRSDWRERRASAVGGTGREQGARRKDLGVRGPAPGQPLKTLHLERQEDKGLSGAAGERAGCQRQGKCPAVVQNRMEAERMQRWTRIQDAGHGSLGAAPWKGWYRIGGALNQEDMELSSGLTCCVTWQAPPLSRPLSLSP